MNIAFDDQREALGHGDGRVSLPGQGQDKAGDTVKILEDFQPDGRAGKITTFAEGLKHPDRYHASPRAAPGQLVYAIRRSTAIPIPTAMDAPTAGRPST